VLDNPFSQRVNAIIGKVREQRRGPYYPHLYIVKEDGEPALRQWALSCLIEDRMETLPSYQQFLGKLKDSVRRLALASSSSSCVLHRPRADSSFSAGQRQVLLDERACALRGWRSSRRRTGLSPSSFLCCSPSLVPSTSSSSSVDTPVLPLPFLFLRCNAF